MNYRTATTLDPLHLRHYNEALSAQTAALCIT